ncbi:MAG: excinuclease ABC subunit UvrC [Gammaproteobacteria bacterium]|nr:MAG: excinuclease ABC subunit UvrC [Gammaproteobacteria bacterium]
MTDKKISAPESEEFNPRPVLRRLPHRPGVYLFLNGEGAVVYVGKARDLRKRVSSYFRAGIPGGKTGQLVRRVRKIEVTVTGSEGEALILENNLIKEHRPRFNVLLRDDKSYPFIHLSSEHPYPRLSFYRGTRKIEGRLFGPYPSAGAVRETLNLLQKLFRIRSCEDSFFAHRSRPCLQYQIQRCSGPCVGLVSGNKYSDDVSHAVQFLEGRSGEVVTDLAEKMEAASKRLEFEEAARFRDQINRLKTVQQQFAGANRDRGDIDVLAVAEQAGVHCVAVMFVRGGRNLGSRTWVPRTSPGTREREVLGAFVAQYYLGRPIPNEILLAGQVDEVELLELALSERAGRSVSIRHRVRGERARWIELAAENARHGVELHIASQAGMQAQLEQIGERLGLGETPARIECFDISHTAGEATVASCVVFGKEGPLKSDYRRFNIADVPAGDDYGAMRQALMRRYTRIKRGEAQLPDLLMVDGGKGQLAEAVRVMDELQIEGVEIVAISKGRSRRPGQEQVFLAGRERPFILRPNSPALLLIQQIRDEAHRFAIAGHRQRRGKRRKRSVLEDVKGLGPKRRTMLLREFGGLHGVNAASVEDLARVKGISRTLARLVYETLHPES